MKEGQVNWFILIDSVCRRSMSMNSEQENSLNQVTGRVCILISSSYSLSTPCNSCIRESCAYPRVLFNT